MYTITVCKMCANFAMADVKGGVFSTVCVLISTLAYAYYNMLNVINRHLPLQVPPWVKLTVDTKIKVKWK